MDLGCQGTTISSQEMVLVAQWMFIPTGAMKSKPTMMSQLLFPVSVTRAEEVWSILLVEENSGSVICEINTSWVIVFNPLMVLKECAAEEALLTPYGRTWMDKKVLSEPLSSKV